MKEAFRVRLVDPNTADAYFSQIASFEADKLKAMRRQRNGAFIGMCISWAAASAMAIALAGLTPLVRIEPLVFVKDNATGIVERNTDLIAPRITEVAAMNLYFARRYTEAREEYVWEEIDANNRYIAASSSQEEYNRYHTEEQTNLGRPKRFGRRIMVRILVKSVFLLSDPEEEKQKGVIQVRFDRAEIGNGDDVSGIWNDQIGCLRMTPQCHTMSAKLDFQRIEKSSKDNPLGWIVTHYEAVSEAS